MRSWHLTVLVLLTLLPVAGKAMPVTYEWTGTVESSSGDPPQGTTVPISVTLDRSYPADAHGRDPKREATYTGGIGTPSGKSPILAITIGGVNAQGWFDSVHVEKNLLGVFQIAIQSAMPQCCRSLSFVFSTSLKSVVKSVAIPRTLLPSIFQSSVFAVVNTANDAYAGFLK